MFLLPFVALSSLPGLRNKIFMVGFLKRQRQRTVNMTMKKIISVEKSPLHGTYTG